jgi:lysophospholipase L1-like esterase
MKSGMVPVPVNASGGTTTYWNVGANCRVIYTTTASKAIIHVNSTAVPNPYGQRTYPTEISYRVNGRDYRGGVAQLGEDSYEILLPGDGTKTVEIFASIQNAIIFGQTPVGVFPIDVSFNAPATAVVPSTTDAHMVMYGDSITVGGYASSMVNRGYAGIAKRGRSDKYLPSTSVAALPRYKGAYSAGTLYALNDVVLYNGSTWLKNSAAAAGTTPALGADWVLRGFDGRVTTEAYGSRRIYDDMASAAQVTAFVAHLAALVGVTAGSRLVMTAGSNDWASGFANAAALQAAVLDFLNKLAGSPAAAIPLMIITPLLTTSRETAGRSDMSLVNIRAAIVAAVAANAAGATPKSGITVVDGSTLITTADMVDGLHINDNGHQKVRNAIG